MLADLSSIVALRLALLREHAHNTIYSRLRPDADARARKLFAAQLQSPNEIILRAASSHSARRMQPRLCQSVRRLTSLNSG